MIINNQQRERVVADQRFKHRQLDDPCDEQCGCSYVERYGLEALVSDREFDRKCRRLRWKLRHQNPCDDQCGCRDDFPRQFVSDAEFDRKCRLMCCKQKHHNLCNEQCGCRYVERYGVEALVSDAEYDRKCGYCHCGHIR